MVSIPDHVARSARIRQAEQFIPERQDNWMQRRRDRNRLRLAAKLSEILPPLAMLRSAAASGLPRYRRLVTVRSESLLVPSILSGPRDFTE